MYSELGGGENRSLSHRGAGRMWDVNEREDPRMTQVWARATEKRD